MMINHPPLKKTFDIHAIRDDFPCLHQMIHGYPLVYLDNAASAQKPKAVIDSISSYYAHDHANVHRGVHTLSVRASEQFDLAREKVQRFIHAPEASECIFVRGTTEAINLVAHSFVEPRVKAGDEILITHIEHHANIVPWQMVCQRTGATLQVAPISREGELCLDQFEKKITKNTRFIALSQASNALGVIHPIKAIIAMAHARGIPVLIDGAQFIPHGEVNVQDLGCDFYVFSGHKLYGPTGIGVLWGKRSLLESMIPYQGGGDMIRSVTFESTEYAPIPFKFEAGTPDIAGAIGLGAAIDYLNQFELDALMTYEADLLSYATEALARLPRYRMIGHSASKVPIVSFVHETIHPHDMGTILDNYGIAIRTGHHCAMPLMNFLGVPATARLSLSFYNTREDIDACMKALEEAERLLL